MTKRDQNRLDSFRLVAKFGADRKAKFPLAKLSGKTFAVVGGVIATMEGAGTGQITGTGQEESVTATESQIGAVLRLSIPEG